MYTVILNGSPRKNGDTVKLINLLVPKINGKYKIINTFYENVSPCIDCRKCHTLNKCVLCDNTNDKMTLFFDDIIKADNIIIASPLHYSMLSGSIMNFVSRFQYFFVSQNIRKDENFYMNKKNGFLVLTGGGATKDFYPIEKVTKLILRQINASLDDILKYVDTDNNSLCDFENFDVEIKNAFMEKINSFAKNINGE